MIPYRSFTAIDHASSLFLNPGGTAKIDWAAYLIPGFYIGFQKNISAAWDFWEYGIAKPSAADYALLAGADEVIDFWWTASYSVDSNTSGKLNTISTVRTTDRYTPGDNSNMAVLTGQVYDTGKDWTSYPPLAGTGGWEDGKLFVFADMPKVYTLYGCPNKAGLGTQDNMLQGYFFDMGLTVRMSQPNGGDIGAGTKLIVRAIFSEIKVRFFNPCVNSLSKMKVAPAGGDALVLTGLGFNNDDTEITNAANNAFSSTPGGGGWKDYVTEIDFIGTAGEGTFALEEAGGSWVVPGAVGIFVIDSNSQITIASMPALPVGTYEINLKKAWLSTKLNSTNTPTAYAGDWRADLGTGAMTIGNRLRLKVGGGGKRILIPGTDWEWPIKKYYAPIDMRAPLVFYDGRILSLSNFTRSVSSGLGTFLGSDADIKLTNVDREFSSLLFANYAKNLGVGAYYLWSDETEASKHALAKFIVDDYNLDGPVFSAKLRDIGWKYFQKELPEYRCTAAEFPNIYEKDINAPKPDLLGTFSWTAGDKPGAIKAPCVDTANFIYLAARGSLYAVDEVYSAGILKAAGADYSISYDGLGQTLITFTGSQGDNEVTFNCRGYSYPAWDSVNGYVQNPARVLEYFLEFLVGVPVAHLETASFDTLAATFAAAGFGTIGKLALTTESACEEYYRQLLYTFGILAAFTAIGKIKIARKDYASLSNFKTVWAQLDCKDHPGREYVSNVAFNRIKAAWDFVPTANLCQGGDTFENLSSQSILDAVLEPTSPATFPWTDSAAWIAIRAAEELDRYAFGDNKFRFTLSIDWLDSLDLLDNIELQDPFGVSPTGAGEAGRPMYIESLTVDLEQMEIAVVCSDLTWILTGLFILGDPTMASNWSTAGPEERVYAYLCDTTGVFADGAPGKKL